MFTLRPILPFLVAALGCLPLVASAEEAPNPPAQEETFSEAPLKAEPVVLIQHLYTAYAKPEEAPTLTPILSLEAATHKKYGYLTGDLKKAATALALAEERDPGIHLGYDPLVDAQDFEITKLVITGGDQTATTAVVNVDFLNFGEKRSFVFRLEKPEGASRWMIAAVECKIGSDGRSYDVQKEMEEALKGAEEE